jgi:hypothetical protein
MKLPSIHPEEMAVSIFLKDLWKEWARDWGLTHYPEKGWVHRTEHLVGERKGLLIRVGWGPAENPGLLTTIRFSKTSDLARLRQALIDDATLDALPGKGARRRKLVVRTSDRKRIHLGEHPEFTLSESSLTWRRAFPWRSPNPSRVSAWVDALIDAVARATAPFDGRCETCATGTARSYVLVDDLPVMMCTACQQRLRTEGEMAERSYDLKEARHVNGAALAVVAALVGGVVWSALAALTERIFAAAAIGIGALVAFGYRMGAGRVDVAGRVIAAVLTLASVVMGQAVLYTWWISKARPDIGFDLDVGWTVYLQRWSTDPGQEILVLFLGLVGAWVASQTLARPKLQAKIEAAVDPEHPSRAA